jgi:hypothetical protein
VRPPLKYESGRLPAESPKKSRRWRSIAVVIIIALVVLGFLVYIDSKFPPNASPSNANEITQTSAQCTISAEGTGFYVTVVTDSGLPVAGAQVSGSRVTEYGSGGTCEQSIGSQYTNSSGTVLITNDMGSYNALTVQYQGKNYAISAPIVPMETTYVTLKVPSGNYSISEVFEGGCAKTASGVTCPG